QKMRKGGEFDPPSREGTILFPGMDGGGEWVGTAFDPKSGLLYVNANEMAWKIKLVERKMPDGEPTTGKALYEQYCAACHRPDLAGSPRSFPRWWTSATGGTWTRSKASCTTEPAACQGTLSCTLPSAGQLSNMC